MARDVDTGIVKPTPATVDEQAKAAAMRAAAKGPTPNEALLANVKAQIAKLQGLPDAPLDLTKPLNKMTPAELKAFQAARLNAQAAAREDVQSGTSVDNPKPTEDPGPGMYWANFGGVWRKYKSPTTTPVTTTLKPGDPGYVAPDVIPADDRPVGTPPAYVYNAATKTWEQPPKPTGAGTWVFDNIQGWVNSTVVPGAGGSEADSKTILAKDTFKNTLALYFGAAEMSKPWVDGLYKSVSGFYKTGSTIAESLNLSLMDVRNNPDMADFTKRFKGVYALTDRLAGGEAVSVPTIAEYFASEAAMGDTLREAGLGDIATQDFLGDVIGRGKSVLEVGKLITDTFTAIDNAPKALKDTLAEYFPTVDRVSLAKALLTGKEGAAALDKKIKGISVLSAAGTQGVKTDLATAGDIAAMGYGYTEALEGFGTVKQLERANVLAGFEGGKFTQEQAQGYVFGKNIAEEERLRLLKEKETARFSGRSGLAASALRGQSTNTIL